MELMKAPQAPVLARVPYGDVECGFMRNSRGEIFFLASHGHGGTTISCPVLKDGTISRHADFGTFPTIVVDLIHPRDLGISEFRWAEQEAA